MTGFLEGCSYTSRYPFLSEQIAYSCFDTVCLALLTRSDMLFYLTLMKQQRCHKGCLQDRLGAQYPPPAVLVPGAGLGRLCHDIASLGFDCEVVLSDLVIWTVSAMSTEGKLCRTNQQGSVKRTHQENWE